MSKISDLIVSSVLVADMSNQSIRIPITLAGEKNDSETVETNTLIDCGAGEVFIDQNFAQSIQLPLKKLQKPLNAYNVDGTLNKKGKI